MALTTLWKTLSTSTFHPWQNQGKLFTESHLTAKSKPRWEPLCCIKHSYFRHFSPYRCYRKKLLILHEAQSRNLSVFSATYHSMATYRYVLTVISYWYDLWLLFFYFLLTTFIILLCITGENGIDHRSLLQGRRFHPVHVASRCIQQLEHVPEF